MPAAMVDTELIKDAVRQHAARRHCITANPGSG